MNLKVKLFGIARDIVAAPHYELVCDGTMTVGDLKKKISADFPDFTGLRSFMVAVNQQYAADELAITATDEVAIIPPVSGG